MLPLAGSVINFKFVKKKSICAKPELFRAAVSSFIKLTFITNVLEMKAESIFLQDFVIS